MPKLLTAHGNLASNIASSFSASDPVVVFDVTGIGTAFSDALIRRSRGERFYTYPLLAAEETVIVDSVIAQVLNLTNGLDARRFVVEQAWLGSLEVNGNPLNKLRVYGDQLRTAVRAIVDLGDALIASSESERRRLQRILQAQPPARIFCAPDAFVPAPSEHPTGSRIVIWAPSLSGDQAAAFALLLNDVRTAKTLVSATPPSFPVAVEWTPLAKATDALAHARVIVDTSAQGAQTALALSRSNAALVCDVETGAHELIDEVHTYSRTAPGSLTDAVYAALGSAASQPHPSVQPSLPPPARDLDLDGPLVSLIVPTFDRPLKLRDALESIERQTYANVEGIVVNDGGPPIDGLVAEYPRSRLITMPENNPPVSANTAFRAARGVYAGILCDDDIVFPDHVAQLVTAMERARAHVAHGNVLTAYLSGDDDRWICDGYDYGMRRSVEYQHLLSNNHLGTTSVLFRRDALPDGVILDEQVPYCRDYALWLRLASKHDFVHVDRITSCYTIRNAGAAQISTMWKDRTVSAFQAIYAMHPVSDDSPVARTRSAILSQLATGDSGFKSVSTIPAPATPWPPWVQAETHA